MIDKSARAGPPVDQPNASPAHQRDAFLNSFFRRGAELTDELVRENELYRERIAGLEKENTSLRTAVASNSAIHDLLVTIERLESEKQRLLSTVHEHETLSSRFRERFHEAETELESLANLHVATQQLHSSLQVPSVMQNIMDLLGQLVGAESIGVYFATTDGTELIPIASAGVELSSLATIAVNRETVSPSTEAILERTYLTGQIYIRESSVESPPEACVPLSFQKKAAGAIAVYSLLPQKRCLGPVDRALFDLLDAQATAALVAAYAVTTGHGLTPSPESLRKLCS